MSPDRLRASHSDRERVLKVLREAATDGRIDLDEFEERSSRAQEARVLGDLPPLTEDLLSAEEQPIRLDHQPAFGVFGTAVRRGRWVAYPGDLVLALFGRVRVDMREALLLHGHHRMVVTAVVGRVEIEVPDGVEVRVNGRSLLGRRSTTARRSDLSNPPVLEIDGFSLLGTVRVRAPRRSRFPRLKRRERRPGIDS
ncbi:DUF1707 domain-containing protein [Nocardiopsis sp. N85]|uniref:DUF1707 SHOCT-like domain-containing protein n=1 Tax=Nocardiopsis sp. N85 TaxID=3029400 RepID=UPI00237F3EC4|nr:DUF1707 domain-containing protein [Nocardiopsis sp. N85]MDE3721732.1 DUF1707 domain-containing protein [Nocardiopsis sp. N85]